MSIGFCALRRNLAAVSAAVAGKPDRQLFLSILILLAIGIMMVLSASVLTAEARFSRPYLFLVKELVWVALGLMALVGCSRLDYHRIQPAARWAAVGALGLLILVLIPGLGVEVGHARRWLGLGPLRFQPSELAKLALILYAADAIDRRRSRMGGLEGIARPLLLLTVCAGLILLEPDFGTTMLVGVVIATMLFLGGARILHLGGMLLAVLPFILFGVLHSPYRLKRVLSFLHPESDPGGAGYQVLQSLVTLGSGGLTGLGPGQGRMKALFLPEPHTDFIFSVLGEEWGLIGTLTVVAIYAVVGWRGLRTARRAPDLFGALLAAGLTLTVVIQALLNMGVTTALLPAKGIPLPLISFGGSSLVVTCAGLGLLLSISRQSVRA